MIKRESFSFLFDRRYTNRLNRMSRIFFEAYVKATHELAAQEDRFPSLSEIDAKMESGAVYAFKDRLMKNTEFFEEIKISGVSYLVPSSSRFIDISGTYSDLFFDFSLGNVILPARRKTPPPVVSEIYEKSALEETEMQEERDSEISKDEEASAPSSPEPTLDQTQIDQSISTYPGHIQEPFIEIADNQTSLAAISDETTSITYPQISGDKSPEMGKTPEPISRLPSIGSKDNRKLAVAALITIFFLLAIGGLLITTLKPTGATYLINYDAYLSNINNSFYLGLDVYNSESMPNDILMTLPMDIDKSISAKGGVVTISHSANTLVQLNSSSDASVKIYLNRNWSSIPVNLSLIVPEGYDSSIEVHGQDYDVKRKDDTLVLGFNLTQEGVRFEQSLVRK
ncbi:MAG: hypothetical protein MUO26_14435 [Methanotrichaceae archaeon]|nr:hypothetical protein [Methanotrichaceae archaeon]